MAASIGLDATGIDDSPLAIEKALAKARERGLDVRFMVGSVLELASLDQRWDTVLDCGVFHVFDDDDRVAYVAELGVGAPPGGRYFMLCFSDLQPGEIGPRRVSQDEIRGVVRQTAGGSTRSRPPCSRPRGGPGPKAWLSTITRM